MGATPDVAVAWPTAQVPPAGPLRLLNWLLLMLAAKILSGAVPILPMVTILAGVLVVLTV